MGWREFTEAIFLACSESTEVLKLRGKPLTLEDSTPFSDQKQRREAIRRGRLSTVDGVVVLKALWEVNHNLFVDQAGADCVRHGGTTTKEALHTLAHSMKQVYAMACSDRVLKVQARNTYTFELRLPSAQVDVRKQ